MGRARSLVWLACGAAACAQEQIEVFVPHPEAGDAKTMIFAVKSEDQLSLFAIDIAGEETIERALEIAGDAVIEIEALLYDETLTALALEEGPLLEDDSGALLDVPRSVHRLEIRPSETTGWSEQSAPSSAVQLFRPRRVSLCQEYSVVTKHRLRVNSDHAFTIALGPERALV